MLVSKTNRKTIPLEVVTLMIEKEICPVAAWCKHRGLTQLQMAEILGVTQGSVAQTEKHGNKLHIETLRAWAEVLGCDVAQRS